MQTRQIRPLNFWESLFLPLLLLLSSGTPHQLWRRRYAYTRALGNQRRAEERLKKDLSKESKVYSEIIVSTFVRLGEAHVKRDPADKNARKLHKVEFEHIFFNPERIYFKIRTVKRTILKRTKSALPFRVWVSDLIDSSTLQELSWSTQRVVTAVYEDPRKGAWIIVNRLEGVGGLPTRVTFEQMLEHYPADMSKATIILGIGEHRKVHSVDLSKHPHVLIAGSTGSGKSNIVKHLISSLLRFTEPDQLQFVLIDLKRTEFSIYKRSGHLYRPIVTDGETAIEVFEALMDEVLRRNELFEDKANELAVWNALYPDQAMPRVIVVIDEFAELMLASDTEIKRDTARLVARLTNLGRSVGIHFWICTQRPAKEVVSNAIKINMPLVIAGRTQNKPQSGVILGNGDAARLPLVPGRMLYQSGSMQFEVQTPLITPEDVRESVRISRGRAQGVITMEGLEPTIVKPALTKLLLERGGSLSGLVIDDLAEFAITRAMFRAYVQDLLKQETITIEDREYQVKHQADGYHLVELSQADEEEISEPPQLKLVERTSPQQAALDFFKTKNRSREATNA